MPTMDLYTSLIQMKLSSLAEHDRVALRNASAVTALFALLNLLSKRHKHSARSEPHRSQQWDEVKSTAMAAALVAVVFGRSRRAGASSGAAALLSLLPLRLLLSDSSFHFNYKFLTAYLSAQVVQSSIPERLRIVPSMLVSASMLLCSWTFRHQDEQCDCQYLPRDYVKFLNREGKIDLPALFDFRRMCQNGCSSAYDVTTDGPNTCRATLPMIFPRPQQRAKTGPDGKKVVRLMPKYNADPLYPSVIGFHRAFLEYWWTHFKESLPFYVKIYSLRMVASALRGGEKSVYSWADDVRTVASWAMSRGRTYGAPGARLKTRVLLLPFDIARSALFLSSYCSFGWYMMGMWGMVFPNMKMRPLLLYLSLCLPGATVLFESPSQQATIANYCATFGLYPVFGHFERWMFDAAGALTFWAAATGKVATPGLLQLLWPPDKRSASRSTEILRGAFRVLKP